MINKHWIVTQLDPVPVTRSRVYKAYGTLKLAELAALGYATREKKTYAVYELKGYAEPIQVPPPANWTEVR